MASIKLLLHTEIILVDGYGFVNKPSALFRYQDRLVNITFSYGTESHSIKYVIHKNSLA